MITNKDLGYRAEFDVFREAHPDHEVGRVIAQHRSRYVVKSGDVEYSAEIIGNLRYSAESRADLPAVGDWVTFQPIDDDSALIYHVFPRISTLARQQVGAQGEAQIIATNIDTAFIVLSVNRDFSINRLERYLTICHASNVSAVVVLSKVDLIDDTALTALTADIEKRLPDLPLVALSSAIGQGLDAVKSHLQAGKTYCLLGSSGVGKSTLCNALMGENVMQTGEISTGADRGKHITTHRELNLTSDGAILIDNPGMREIGVTEGGLESTFEYIETLAQQCKFNDCTHTNEIGCTVQQAIEQGELGQETFDNYLKVQREQAHFESTNHERKQKYKALSKRVRQAQKGKKNR